VRRGPATPSVADVSLPVRVMWFRRDLRLHDHPALLAAAGALHGQPPARVLPLFVVDPRLIRGAGAVRPAYLAASLGALDADLRERGGGLVVRRGVPAIEVVRAAREAGAEEVHVSADFTPYGTRRDAAVEAALAEHKIALIRTGSPYAVAPGRVTKPDGTPYSVYTPFFKAWEAHGWAEPAGGLPDRTAFAALDGDALPTWSPPASLRLPPAGERAALERWAHVRETVVDSYADLRDRPDLAGTSELSAALRWGEIHPRTLLAELGDDRGPTTFRKELAWREFYADVLHHRPTSAWTTWREDMAGMRVDDDAAARERFDAWCAGRTGYPFVDAGMRQLLAEGWMHNRVRMVTASFLVKDLHLPWQWGARHFLDHLRDGDVASNQHGWQWAAGTGTDAAPYFRIFNPVTQGLRFDPDGDYVRRYVPALRDLEGAAAHQPWTAPLLAGDYPERIVDHARERDEALARLAEIKPGR
jgi:deoxyribodipyrimidine photo-lyase